MALGTVWVRLRSVADRAHASSRRSAAAAGAAAVLAVDCEPIHTPAMQHLSIRLTAREMQIARLAAAGHTSPQIAERLYISVRTVDNHLAAVYTKLGIHSRQELADLLAGTQTIGTAPSFAK